MLVFYELKTAPFHDRTVMAAFAADCLRRATHVHLGEMCPSTAPTKSVQSNLGAGRTRRAAAEPSRLTRNADGPTNRKRVLGRSEGPFPAANRQHVDITSKAAL